MVIAAVGGRFDNNSDNSLPAGPPDAEAVDLRELSQTRLGAKAASLHPTARL
jgi:hypothetical protein